MDWVLDKVVDQSDCGASVGNTKITDLVFANDAVIFAESLEVLVMALEALHEEAKLLGLEVSWLKTRSRFQTHVQSHFQEEEEEEQMAQVARQEEELEAQQETPDPSGPWGRPSTMRGAYLLDID
ncbi:hypothetical protein GWK47_017730 [Chionoecetes opilio]|uniref:Reverse transcriptase domain-containing protein n=1 Tax=Chionoecetes opilio TaxID=41210 RepID=A0A8J4XTR4_CHIOP|nr:hypothetical protein GWK47_017730 [Chionoecetes opilio]